MSDPGLPPGAERRQHPREAANETVKIVSAGGHAFDAVVVDRSLRGLRVRLEAAASLPSDVHVLSRTSGSVHIAKVVWRTPPHAGLSISRTVEMRTATGSDTADLRRMWREHIQT